MRFRIGELLIVVAVVCFSVASIRQSSDWFLTMFFSFTIVVILFSMAMAIGRTGQRRCFWSAFAISSFAYLLLAHVPHVPHDEDSFAYEYDLPRFRYDGPEVTTQLLRYAYEQSHECELSLDSSGRGSGGVFSLPDQPQFETQQDEDDPIGSGGGFGGQSSGGGGFGGQSSGGGGGFGGQFAREIKESDFDALIELVKKSVPADDWADWADTTDSNKVFPSNAGGIRPVYRGPDIEDDFAQFMLIGHCSWALLIGWISGHFCSFVASRSGVPDS